MPRHTFERQSTGKIDYSFRAGRSGVKKPGPEQGKPLEAQSKLAKTLEWNG